jgi:hypothetical protein
MAAQGLPTCRCGSTDFKESTVRMELEVPTKGQWSSGQPMVKDVIERKTLWTRTCNACSEVTFWSKPSGKEN